MDKLDYIKSGIERLYKTNPNVHITVKLLRPKINIEAAPAVIKGAYKNIFQIEEYNRGFPSRHTFQYSDVIIGHVAILELDYAPSVNELNKK